MWAILLLCYTVGFSYHSPGFASLWVLIWLPGLYAWYGYIRRAFGHYLFRRAMITWLVSVVANSWSFFLMWSYFGGRVGDLPVMVCVAYTWIILAIVISIACLIQERRLREPKREVAAHVDYEQFRRLLDEHQRDDG